MTQHRLPLFLRSDLYSEYKLCRLLAGHVHDSGDGINSDAPRPCKSRSATKLPTKKPQVDPSTNNGSSSAVCLPSLSSCNVDSPLCNSSPSLTALSHISTSKSDTELGSKGRIGSVMSPNQRQAHLQKLQKQVSISVDIPCIVLEEGSTDQAGINSSSVVKSPVSRMTADDFDFLGTKSGMSALWKFLRGTVGERNWLFWLDAERVKYYSKPIDQQRYMDDITSLWAHKTLLFEIFISFLRLLREVRERYLHSGSPLELPAETRNRLRVSKASRLTLSQLKEIQLFMVQGLREYWYDKTDS